MQLRDRINVEIICDEESLPHYETELSAGCDLRAKLLEPRQLGVGEMALICTGIKIRIREPHRYEAQVRSRSGLASKGIIILNSPGTVDMDYRGFIKVLLFNLGTETFTINPNMRIAQMIFARVYEANFKKTSVFLPEKNNTRGEGGFGSTGY